MLNRVVMVGRLAHSPDVREKDEKKTAFLRLAVQRDIKGNDGVDADFFDVVAFGKTAEFAEKYLAKGRQIAVEGRLQTRTYTDREGNKRTTISVVADHVWFCDSKQAEEPPVRLPNVPPREIPEATKEYGRRLAEDLATPLPVPEPVSDDELPY